MREYALYCVDCHEYTSLGAFVDKEGHFEGEYSLLHNRKANHDEVMCRFLIRHARHTLRMEESRTKPYSDILRTAGRFMEAQIDEMIERQIERSAESEHERTMERGLGQLQLNVLRGILLQEFESISRERGDNAAKAQFLLGKEEGMKRALGLLDDLLEKTNLLFR
ncbi:hypothetical protein [Paenibacillus sp.]|uniref:hypothetical protein n=1 Tax=Paenibacillus sp. TaxID=58172 RepID=UPI002D41202D|nr:hypothetical protein [Paenibacillus sp.]HZG57386.1 hypothetical protein [Paenibacillus sp.]